MAKQSIIVIRPKNTAFRFFYIAVALFIFNLAGIFFQRWLGYSDVFTNKFVDLFDAAAENNIPALFTTLILFISSVLLFVIYLIGDWQVQRNKNYWLLLSLIFLFLSVDEAISIHEQSGGIAKLLPSDIPGYSRFAWIPFYGFFVLIAGIFFIRFLFRVPAKTRKLFIISGSIYVFAVFSFEFPEGYMAAVSGVNYKYFLLCSLEEFLEMTGVILFIYALLDYLSFFKPSMQIIHKEKQSFVGKTNSVFIHQSELNSAGKEKVKSSRRPWRFLPPTPAISSLQSLFRYFSSARVRNKTRLKRVSMHRNQQYKTE